MWAIVYYDTYAGETFTAYWVCSVLMNEEFMPTENWSYQKEDATLFASKVAAYATAKAYQINYEDIVEVY